MSTVKNNNIFEKTSFLGGNSSEFIEELYSQYVQNPKVFQKNGKNFLMVLKIKKKRLLTRQMDQAGQEKKVK